MRVSESFTHGGQGDYSVVLLIYVRSPRRLMMGMSATVLNAEATFFAHGCARTDSIKLWLPFRVQHDVLIREAYLSGSATIEA